MPGKAVYGMLMPTVPALIFHAEPVPAGRVERGAGGVDCAVDIGLGRHCDLRKRLTGGGLDEVAQLAGDRLGRLAVDEQAVLALGCHRHRQHDNEFPGPGSRAEQPRDRRSYIGPPLS